MTAMNNEQFPQGLPGAEEGTQRNPEETSTPRKTSVFTSWMESLAHLGLGELTTRIGTNVLSLLFILAVVWLMRTFYHEAQSGRVSGPSAVSGASADPLLTTLPDPFANLAAIDGIARRTLLHTSIPSRPRIDVIHYTVQPGDTLFGIAEKYGLNPKTILWGNYYTFRDDPHNLRPGQELNILPVDGTYYQWNETDALPGVAKFFGVDPETIVIFPGNHLDPDTIGDYAHPNIPAGAWLVVPGGSRLFTNWQAPVGVTRDKPATARQIGPGACGAITGGAVGFGTFVWPTPRHFLSGYDYTPDANHWGIDLAGDIGSALYATDAGVIVYAGWNDYGYGNLIIIDHGDGWQSLYAHIMENGFLVVCGQSVGQGEMIAYMGNTGNSSGPHLHFELMNTSYGKVNPWNFLPPP